MLKELLVCVEGLRLAVVDDFGRHLGHLLGGEQYRLPSHPFLVVDPGHLFQDHRPVEGFFSALSHGDSAVVLQETRLAGFAQGLANVIRELLGAVDGVWC